MTPKDLDKFLKVCKKYGVVELSLDSFKVKIDSYSSAQAPKSLPTTDNVASTPDVTEEDVMFWSSPAASAQE